MVDRINKVLGKLSAKERTHILRVLEQIQSGNLSTLDVKKMKGLEGVYRVRVGSFRIIFLMRDGKTASIIAVERRSDTTYNQFHQ